MQTRRTAHIKPAPKQRRPLKGKINQRLQQLEMSVRELTFERDLYRKEWLKSLREIVPYMMTDEEAQSILQENITLERVIQEMEPMLRKSKSV